MCIYSNYLSFFVYVYSHLDMFNSLTPWTVAYQAPCPWDFLGKNTGVGCHFFLQGTFPAQGLNPGFLHCRQILYWLSHQGSPRTTGPMCNSVFYFTKKIRHSPPQFHNKIWNFNSRISRWTVVESEGKDGLIYSVSASLEATCHIFRWCSLDRQFPF